MSREAPSNPTERERPRMREEPAVIGRVIRRLPGLDKVLSWVARALGSCASYQFNE
jgi:hypothetical protein